MSAPHSGRRQDLGYGLLLGGVGLLVLAFAVLSLVGGRNPFLPAPAAVAAGLLGLLLLSVGVVSLARGLGRRRPE